MKTLISETFASICAPSKGYLPLMLSNIPHPTEQHKEETFTNVFHAPHTHPKGPEVPEFFEGPHQPFSLDAREEFGSSQKSEMHAMHQNILLGKRGFQSSVLPRKTEITLSGDL